MPPTMSLEDEVRRLTSVVIELESRVKALEQGAATPAAAAAAAAAAPAVTPAAVVEPARFDPLKLVPSLGRALIILGGGFFLRALTDAGTWPAGVGVTVGLGYALVWVGTAVRFARKGLNLAAGFDGAVAVTIAFPLVVEAEFKFGLLSPPVAMGLLAVVTTGGLLVAAASGLRSLASIASLGGIATAVTLMVRSGVAVPFSLYATALGVGTLWLAYLREWKWLRWPIGMIAALGVLGVTLRATASPPQDAAGWAWACQGALLAGYLGSIAIRTLVRGRQVVPFEMVQTIPVLAVGLGGAIAVGQVTGAGGTILGWVIIALGAVVYLVAFQFVARHLPGAMNFYFYSSLALLFLMTGAWTALHGVARSSALVMVTALLAGAWARSGRTTLGVHVTIVLVAASAASGLLAIEWDVIAGALPGIGPSRWPAAATWVLACGLAVSPMTRVGPRLQPRDATAIVVNVIAWSGLMAAVILSAARGASAAEGALATIRTATMSLGAVGAAWAGRFLPTAAAAWLAYPLLLVTGAKLIAADSRVSDASTMFVALACYGAALALVSRMKRK